MVLYKTIECLLWPYRKKQRKAYIHVRKDNDNSGVKLRYCTTNDCDRNGDGADHDVMENALKAMIPDGGICEDDDEAGNKQIRGRGHWRYYNILLRLSCVQTKE